MTELVAIGVAAFALGGFTRVWWLVGVAVAAEVVLFTLVAMDDCEKTLGKCESPPLLDPALAGLAALAGLFLGTLVGTWLAESERRRESAG